MNSNATIDSVTIYTRDGDHLVKIQLDIQEKPAFEINSDAVILELDDRKYPTNTAFAYGVMGLAAAIEVENAPRPHLCKPLTTEDICKYKWITTHTNAKARSPAAEIYMSNTVARVMGMYAWFELMTCDPLKKSALAEYNSGMGTGPLEHHVAVNTLSTIYSVPYKNMYTWHWLLELCALRLGIKEFRPDFLALDGVGPEALEIIKEILLDEFARRNIRTEVNEMFFDVLARGVRAITYDERVVIANVGAK